MLLGYDQSDRQKSDFSEQGSSGGRVNVAPRVDPVRLLVDAPISPVCRISA